MRFQKKKIRKNKVRRRIFCLLTVFLLTFLTSGVMLVGAMGKKEVKGYVKVQSRLNLREDPVLDAPIIGKLMPGEIVTIISTENEKWTQVETDTGVTGYVCNDYLVIPWVDVEEYELVSVSVITAENSSENRNFNMARASNYINGLILHPGDEFAWYTTDTTEGIVGPASKENGYKIATVISGGKYVEGYGGGVCQVSTTLYNCINKLEIEPTEHHHHSLKSSYVQEGMDATVSYPNKNFVFTNTKDYTIMFEAYTDGGQVVVAAYKVLY